MDPNDFLQLKIQKAKQFGFPEPIYLNAEKLTSKSRVIYLVEIQATHILDQNTNKTHHFALKFSKYKKIKEEPFWIEEELCTEQGFSIGEKSSIEKLAAYIKANQILLDLDLLSKDFTSAILSNDSTKITVLKQILESPGTNKNQLFEILKNNYPNLDKKLLAHKLVAARRKSLEEFENALYDPNKKERNFWQPFLEKNRWMFGISYIFLLNEDRIDLWDTPDYILESEDGFIDIVEIKHPHFDFWQKGASGSFKKYRDYLQPSEELRGGITQASNYIFQLEKRFSDPDWCRRNKCEAPVKPCCIIIFGRSNKWEIEEKTAFRLLNDSLHGISIITFDHLYSRANRLLESMEKYS